jgi:hypothetical protein
MASEVACGEDGNGGRASALNALFGEWNQQRLGGSAPTGKLFRYGTVDWLFREYKSSKAYLEKWPSVRDRTMSAQCCWSPT